MFKKLLSFSLGLFLLLQNVQAQYAEVPNAISVKGLLLSYDYPLDNDFSNIDFTGGVEVEYSRHIANALNLAFPLKVAKANLPVDEMNFNNNIGLVSLDAVLQLKYWNADQFLNPYIFAGVGAVYEDLKELGFAAPVGLGFNFRVAPYTYFAVKGEYRFGFDDFRDNAQLGAGFTFLLGGKASEPVISDRDGDGLPDEEDLCPDVAGEVALNGCPDSDKDGIADGEDECPTEAGLRTFNGCPDSDNDGIKNSEDDCPNEAGLPENNGCPVKDRDGDGVDDDLDQCPDEPGLPNLQGCPDRDGDGVADNSDNCPDEPGSVAAFGCPDSDGDGVLDKDDRCPNTAGPASNNGCPDIKEEDKEILEFATQAVQFETARATLKSESYPILDQIAEILKTYADHSLKIGGHTDSIGSSTKNQDLSERRAKACYDYFISKGISVDRMEYAGFGETRPIADNKYKAGREKNRRVEFDVYLK
jgi:outer membrane protein OmpA-like peptidoglycan-associated protein